MDRVYNTSLKAFNTFGIDVKASEIIHFNSVEDLKQLASNGEFENGEHLVLGGGSNILLTSDFEGKVFINQIGGIEVVEENEKYIIVEVGGGVVWHDFVMHCVDKSWGGVENLSLIPGSVGAAPMQNIGAYGVEINETFHLLKAVNKLSGGVEIFDNAACQFGYRTSIFKTSHKNQYVIASVQFRLSKKDYQLNLEYGAIRTQLENNGISAPTMRDVSDAVIHIRQSKLPDPKKIGNSGSFFKNPILPNEEVKKLKLKYPEIPVYSVDESHSKVAAGWLIEKAGWKGKTFDNYGVHKNQALVLVNYGGAEGRAIYNLSEEIIEDIHARFNVELVREVNIV